MSHSELLQKLHYMGIDERTYRVLTLLPLVHVAWADGEVQESERKVIMELAEGAGLANAEAMVILESWLMNAPSDQYIRDGRELLIRLARVDSGPLSDGVDVEVLHSIVGFSESVARAAGGLFGLVWTVNAQESEALREIAAALDIEPDAGLTWDELGDLLQTEDVSMSDD